MSEENSPVAVVGLGRIGLPLAAQFASKGLRVTGCDIDAALVERVAAGACPYEDEDGLEPLLKTAHDARLLSATTDTTGAAAESAVVVIIVPVGLTAERRPDFSALDDAARAIAPRLRRGSLIVLETTVPVGTTRRRLGPLLEAGGLKAGRDFSLAYSPERVYVGRVLADLRRYPKIVGGIDAESTRRAVTFYERALDATVTPVASCETAEFVKLAETTYRDVNIALANELARAADDLGVDVTEAIEAANSQPFSHIHQPGVGVGGHCIPVYPRFLLENAPEMSLPRTARETNDGMAGYAAEKLSRALGGLSGRTVLILGLSYRPNIKEAAHSSALLLARELSSRGASVFVHDPYFTDAEVRALGLEPPPVFPPPQVDALAVQAFHDQYRGLDPASFPGCSAVLDGRNVLRRETVEAAGLRYLGIGR